MERWFTKISHMKSNLVQQGLSHSTWANYEMWEDGGYRDKKKENEGKTLDPYIHGRVLWATKCERINNRPLHVDLEVIAFHIWLLISLRMWRSLRWKNKISPSLAKNFFQSQRWRQCGCPLNYSKQESMWGRLKLMA